MCVPLIMNQIEMQSLNRPITRKEVELVIKNLPLKQSPRPDGSMGIFYQTLKTKQNRATTKKANIF